VGGGQDGVKVTLLEATLGTGTVESGSAALNVAGGKTAGLELGSTVAQVGTLDGAEKGAALGDLLGQVMAGVGNDTGGKQGQARGDSLGETHFCEHERMKKTIVVVVLEEEKVVISLRVKRKTRHCRVLRKRLLS
jgi:hypothetical protein